MFFQKRIYLVRLLYFAIIRYILQFIEGEYYEMKKIFFIVLTLTFITGNSLYLSSCTQTALNDEIKEDVDYENNEQENSDGRYVIAHF